MDARLARRGSTYGDVRARRSRDSRLVLLAERSHRRRGSQGFARLRRPPERSLGALQPPGDHAPSWRTVNHDTSTGEIIATYTTATFTLGPPTPARARQNLARGRAQLHTAVTVTPGAVLCASGVHTSAIDAPPSRIGDVIPRWRSPDAAIVPRVAASAVGRARPSLRRGSSPRRPRRHRPRVPQSSCITHTLISSSRPPPLLVVGSSAPSRGYAPNDYGGEQNAPKCQD